MSHVVDQAIAALNAADVEAFVACYSASARIEDGEGVVLAHGHEGVRTRYGSMFAEFPSLRVESRGTWRVGQYVIQDEQVIGRALIPERHVAIYRVVDGTIAHERLLR